MDAGVKRLSDKKRTRHINKLIIASKDKEQFTAAPFSSRLC